MQARRDRRLLPALLRPPSLKTLAALALLLVACSGCVATRLTPEGREVRVTSDPDDVRACTRIGDVEARRELNRPRYASSEEDVLRRLRNSAGAVGANVVLVDPSVPVEATYRNPSTAPDRVSETAPRYPGVAYRCPPPS